MSNTKAADTDVLPPELAKRVERLLAQFDRGLVTHSELQNNLLEAVHSFAGQEYERTHPDWANDALFDRAMWETEFEAKRQAEAKGWRSLRTRRRQIVRACRRLG